jgi:hypothetical protein
MCGGYPATTVQGDCTVCGGGYYFTMEEFTADIPTKGDSPDWATRCHGDGQDDYGNRCVGYANSESPCTKCCAQNRVHNSGRVESESPIKVYAYRGDIPTVIMGVREDSITVEDRKGVLTLVFEFMDGSRIGYFPHVDWYSTESE